ncbi:MAG TPA: phasin family protein [Acetobacteraceae bacterium]|nr:phasin family protein [Acetobacteraceae bacterium]
MTTTKLKPGEVAASAVAETQEAVTQTFDRTVGGIKEGVAAATASFAQAQAKVKESMDKAMQTAEEIVAFNQGNLEAVVKSGQIWAAGVQDLSRQAVATAQARMDETMSAFKAVTAAKSLKEAVELQSGFARSSVEKALAEAGRVTEASFRLAEQSFAPIAARVSLAVEKFGKTA